MHGLALSLPASALAVFFCLGSFITTPQFVCISSLLLLLLTMPPKPKDKGKKGMGDTVSAPSTKHTKKATKCSQVPVTPVQELAQTVEDEDVASTQETMSQKLETMMEMLVDLSHRVKASKNQQRNRAASLIASPCTSHPDGGRAQHQCHLHKIQTCPRQSHGWWSRDFNNFLLSKQAAQMRDHPVSRSSQQQGGTDHSSQVCTI